MKKICQTLKLKRFKTAVNEEYFKENKIGYYVLFEDNTWQFAWEKTDLLKMLRKDHIKPIHCIFDRTDKICIDRDVLIDLEGKNNEEIV